MGVRASYVAVVIVVVGVDASLVPVNGPLGLNRRRGVCVGRLHHSLTPFKSPWGSGGGSGGQRWHGISAQSISVRRRSAFTPSAPSSLHPSSASSLTSLALGSGAGAVISQSLAMILAFHVLQDFMSDESMCSAGPCALCLAAASDARGQTLRLRRACEEAFPTQRGQKTLFHRLTDLLLKYASHMRPRRRKKNTF